MPRGKYDNHFVASKRHGSFPTYKRRPIEISRTYYVSRVSTEENIIPEPPRRHSWTGVLLVGMAGVLFASGVAVSIYGLRTTEAVRAQTSSSSSIDSGNKDVTPAPDETKPDASKYSAHTVPPSHPRYLNIPKVGVEARIIKVGVDKKNQLIAPRNVHDVGWYENSSKPGDSGGAILLDGHVAGPTISGVFSKLKDIKPGDTLSIERGDGQKYDFKVVKSQTYDSNKVDMAAALTSVVPGKLGLNLMTCTGGYDSDAGEYKQRLIVFAIAI